MPKQLYTSGCKFLDQSNSLRLKPKSETVLKRRFHWIIFFKIAHPGVSVFLFFWFSWVRQVASCEGINACCVDLGVQTSVCDLKTTHKNTIYSCCVFPPCFLLLFLTSLLVFHAAFFRALFWCVFVLLLGSAFGLFSHLSPRPTCCLDAFYAIHRCFVFVLCFLLCFCFF